MLEVKIKGSQKKTPVLFEEDEVESGLEGDEGDGMDLVSVAESEEDMTAVIDDKTTEQENQIGV